MLLEARFARLLIVFAAASLLLADSCHCGLLKRFGWPAKDGPLAEANRLLLEANPRAETLVQLIQGARSILSPRSKFGAESEWSKTLARLVQLEPLAKQAEGAALNCTDELALGSLLPIKQTLQDHSSSRGEQNKLAQLLASLQLLVAQKCFEEYRVEYANIEPTLDPDRVSALIAMRELVSDIKGHEELAASGIEELDKVANGLHEPKMVGPSTTKAAKEWYTMLIRLHKVYHDKYQFRLVDKQTGKLEKVSTGELRQLFDQLVWGTCNYFKTNQRLAKLLARVLSLAGSLELRAEMIVQPDQSSFDMSGLSLGWQLCRDMETKLDEANTIDRLRKHVECCEHKSLNLKFDNQMPAPSNK